MANLANSIASMPRPQVRSFPRPRGLERTVSLAEVLDRVLNKGAVVQGEVVITLAGVDLLYLGVNLVLTSVETACRSKQQMGAIDVVS